MQAADLQSRKVQMDQAAQSKKEKERVREENERIKKKERELKEAEEERNRLEALERPRILAAKREKMIAERLARRLAQAESSENVLAEKEAELAEKNETRAQSHFLAREAVLAMCENRGVEVRKVERKFEELRRVFVYLDRDNDGIISALDVKKRLVDLGCKTTLKKAQTLMDEIKFTFGKGHNVKYPTLNLYNDRGELFGQRSPLQGRDHWAWAMKMHQPALPSKDEQQKSEFENWSLAGQSKASTEPSVVPERSWDSIGEADATNPVRCDWLVHPATHHMSMIQRWTENQSQHRILCPDSIDCSTRQDVQHPAALSPRKFLDMSPQNSTSESVEAVMLTESGLMTEKDWRAHIAMADADHHSGSGLSWVGLRDCFFKYLVDMGDEDPLPFFTIVEFLTFDRDGKGTASLEDCLSLIFKRFGPPSDTQFVKLFGNSANPGEQIRLPDYLDKVRRLMKMRQISKPSRGRTATAQFEANLQQNRSRRPGEVGQVQVLSL